MKRAAIVGLGAIGGYMFWGLQAKKDLDLLVIADGSRLEKLRTQGIEINDVHYNINAMTADEAAARGPVDLILAATKYNALPSALSSIKKLTSENTLILSLLNGIDSEEIIAKEVDESHILYSFMKISSHRSNQTIRFDPVLTEGVYFGDKNSREPNEKIKAVEEVFEGSNVKYTFVSDIVTKQWGKFVMNLGGNLPQAVLGVGVGAYADSSHVNFISEMMWTEGRAVAKAKGIDIEPYPFITKKRNAPSATRWSTLQDLDSKRHTEIDMFCGTMIRLGKELNIPVPFNTYTYHAIKALEEKNDGKFDY